MSQANLQEQRLVAAAAKRLERLRVRDCFDPINHTSRPTPQQQEILDGISTIQFRYAVAGNQAGKTAVGARETSWLLEGIHPTFKRPERWGTAPLLMIVAARTHAQIESNLWLKIKGFLSMGDIKEIRTGQQLTQVIHVPTGNTILFMSHHSEREAREKMQGFTAHYVWIDEMPGSVDLLEELHRRVQSNAGRFLATFTPKVRNDRIKRLVDSSAEPHSKKYRMSMMDNPVLTDRDKEAILSSMSSYSEAYKRTILYGDWSGGEGAVYNYNSDVHSAALPREYERGWRHVASVDPAQSSKTGLTVWAEDVTTGVWYSVLTDYVEGAYAPSELIREIEKRLAGYNISRRIYDPHETWFMREAALQGITYMGVYNKSQRKHELIMGLQEAFTSGIIKLTPWCEKLIDEIMEYSRDEDGAIINSSRFHLIDSAQYFVDLKPKYDPAERPMTYGQWLREGHKAGKAAEQKKSKLSKQTMKRANRLWS